MWCTFPSPLASCSSLNHSYSSQASLGQGFCWPLCYWALLMDTDVGGFLGTRALPPLSHRFLSPSFWVSLWHHLNWTSVQNSHLTLSGLQSTKQTGAWATQDSIYLQPSPPKPPNTLWHVDGHQSPLTLTLESLCRFTFSTCNHLGRYPLFIFNTWII